MIWRSRRGWVVREADQYFVLSEGGAVLAQYAPATFPIGGLTYHIDHHVQHGQLVARTRIANGLTIDERGHASTMLEDQLVIDDTEAGRALRSTRRSRITLQPIFDFASPPFRPARAPEPEPEPELHAHLREAEASLNTPPEPVKATLSPDVQRAIDRLQAKATDELCRSMHAAMQLLAEDTVHQLALTAFARASLLLLHDEAPSIDESWTPVSSPLARRVARFVDRLDERGAREAADAMETCAALLGYRDGFPVA